mmetsp:Transcript_70402/g.204078  ORF Transcript_70402/g.204078 Transcript_70402/m.204078 type:complete len:203 (+) Transcript_70402:161-769(+)
MGMALGLALLEQHRDASETSRRRLRRSSAGHRDLLDVLLAAPRLHVGQRQDPRAHARLHVKRRSLRRHIARDDGGAADDLLAAGSLDLGQRQEPCGHARPRAEGARLLRRGALDDSRAAGDLLVHLLAAGCLKVGNRQDPRGHARPHLEGHRLGLRHLNAGLLCLGRLRVRGQLLRQRLPGLRRRELRLRRLLLLLMLLLQL